MGKVCLYVCDWLGYVYVCVCVFVVFMYMVAMFDLWLHCSSNCEVRDKGPTRIDFVMRLTSFYSFAR